jgi:hypothetical protein
VGAALHLAHAHQPGPGPQRKRKGGGNGGDGYDELVARVYADDRHTSESRELILCLAWLICRDPADRFDDPERSNIYERANRILGFDATKSPRLARLIREDIPRYEPDMKHSAWDARCNAPMIRRAGECGQAPRGNTFRVDPNTGWRTPIWFCNRHRAFGESAAEALRAMPKPEPIPNTGGLLPSYLELRTGEAGWTRLYLWAAKWGHYRWEPPTRYGLCADDWPRPDRQPTTPAAQPARLRLAALDGKLVSP